MIISGHGNLIFMATVKDKAVTIDLLLLIYFSDDKMLYLCNLHVSW